MINGSKAKGWKDAGLRTGNGDSHKTTNNKQGWRWVPQDCGADG